MEATTRTHEAGNSRPDEERHARGRAAARGWRTAGAAVGRVLLQEHLTGGVEGREDGGGDTQHGGTERALFLLQNDACSRVTTRSRLNS